MSGKKIKVALIGFGWVVRYFHFSLLSAVHDLSIEVIGTNRVKEVSNEFPELVVMSPQEAIVWPEIDLVIIASVNESHFKLAALALNSGKHVVVEKPFTPTLEEARYLTRLAEEKGKILSVFQNRRWDSDFLTVKSAIKNGLLGDVVHFESHIDRFVPVVANAWREIPGPGAGTWFDLGPHIGDQALQLFGLPDLVTASFACQRRGTKTDDWFHVVLEYKQLRVILHASQLVPSGGVRFIIHGTEGSLIKVKADPQEMQMLSGVKPTDVNWGVDADKAIFYAAGSKGEPQLIETCPGDQSQFYVQLAQAIHGNAVNPVSPAEAVAVMALLETASKSVNEMKSLALPLNESERCSFEQSRCQRF